MGARAGNRVIRLGLFIVVVLVLCGISPPIAHAVGAFVPWLGSHITAGFHAARGGAIQ